MSENPFCWMANDGIPLLELKQGLVLYVEDPPNPAQAKLVYDHYIRHCGARIRIYRSTAQGSEINRWDQSAQMDFERRALPNLRKRNEWGYAFSDDKKVNSRLFMFHGFRPHTQTGKASFYRFDFDWNVDLKFLRDFTDELISLIPSLSGFAGYYFQGRAGLLYASQSFDKMFSLAMRYCGIEAHNLDVTVNYMLEGYKCVNWLTIIGDKFRKANPEAVEKAKDVAFDYSETQYAVLLQADQMPRFGDRNRGETLDGYVAIAKALLPLQITEHAAFGGKRWTDENTIEYIRRFTG